MKILFIITGSIAVSKCYDILSSLKKNKIEVNCLITNNAKKLLNTSKIKQNISGKIYTGQKKTKRKKLWYDSV